jgi:hypothetical protein
MRVIFTVNSGSRLAFQVLGLPANATVAQDLADGLGAGHDPVPLAQVFDQFGQAPRGERTAGLLRRGAGDAADQLACVGADGGVGPRSILGPAPRTPCR